MFPLMKTGGFHPFSSRISYMATADFITVDGCLALKGSEFGDTDKGWALVLVNGDRCSTQCIVTRNNAYERYTTEEALAAAAEKYGGLTD